jgi:hypothetical protein
MEDWTKIRCKSCTTPNWIYGGDPNDMTYPDVVGFICHKCAEPNSMCPDDEFFKEQKIDDPEAYEFGLEQPT